MSGENSSNVLELVTFKLVPGVTEDQFVVVNEQVSAWVSRQPGFVSRYLSFDEKNDTYIDVVYWESLAAAELANEMAMTSTECAPMFGMCQPESVNMVHAAPIASVVAV
jgi:hypothetical protein